MDTFQQNLSAVPGKRKTSPGRAVAAASIGNALEWYDFTIYALFAVYIAKNFFPGGDDTVELVKAFLAFGLGFVIRPLGAIMIGVYGDKAGRKAALFLTIMIMAVGTLMIAIAPTYAAIGIGAPLMILAGRILQGFSAGGEIGGAAAFLVEHAPPEQKGKFASWLQASMAISNIMGALVAFAVTSLLTEQQVGDWGWRIPFFIGVLIAPVGLWLRRTLDETPAFEAERASAEREPASAPLKLVFTEYLGALLKGTAFSILWAVCVYVLIIYMPIFVQRAFGFAPSQAFTASLIGNVFLAVGCVFAGTISDKIGRRLMLGIAAAAMLVAVYPLLAWLQSSPTLTTLIIVQSLFCIMVSGFVGVAPATLSEVFPTHIRSTGMSLAYNTAVTIFGGFAPAMLTWLSTTAIGNYAPSLYVSAAALISLIAIIVLPKPHSTN
ncbi:MFS transporter [Paracoccus caeni]|uniref:MFS transporter n=1 Tax=Paracoccus caeni TaxID=657651 RepID=A0A934SHI8_9RHOB|nr:MFS transporter [Paracoccus caeni]MBK4217962.1 MFS transporter [Paracoccus caeni]